MARLLGITRFWNYISDWIECRVHLRPEKDGTLDLGSSDYQWRRVYIGPGSVSAPAVLLDGDSDTGIYQSAADNLDFATGGVQRLNISNTAFTVKNLFSLGAFNVLTISGGAITPTCARHRVDTEGGAASDDLTTINGNVEGALLVLSSATYSRVVTLKDGADNLRLAGDFALSNSDHIITLVYNGGLWREISRSAN